jgi:hypothetical protein
MIVPTSAAIWRRTAETRCNSEPPVEPSTSGTRPNPMHSSSGSSDSASWTWSRGEAGGSGAAASRAASSATVAASASAALPMARPPKKNSAPMIRNGSFGRPGMSANEATTPPATIGARRWPVIWLTTWEPRSCVLAARVTMMPVATEISSAGICAARPSPTDSSEKCCTASPKGRFCISTPITMPPMRLIIVISTAAIASPLTNFEAPSIAP